MRSSYLLPIAAAAASGTLALHMPVSHAPRASSALSRVPRSAVCMESTKQEGEKKPTSYEEYIQKRIDSGEDLDSAYSDLGQDIDFDGGDSGSGAVGDGKITLDDQHNSPYIVGSGSMSDAVMGAQNAGVQDKYASRSVKAAVNARDVKQKNYWGRQVGTGYADSLAEDQRYKDRPVLRQQLENWQNQQALKTATDAQLEGMSNFYGQSQDDAAMRYRKEKGRPIDSIRSEIYVENTGSNERLDGGEWGPVTVPPNVQYEAEYELYGTPNVPGVLDIAVLNEISSFSPFRVAFTPESPASMSVTPTEGVMEKRASMKTTDLVVRFTPSEYGIPVIGELVFETEDFKKVYKIVGMTAHNS